MQIQLSPEAADFVQRKIAAGEFTSPGEVIDEAIEFFESHEPTMESLKAKIAEGLADEAAGRVAPLDMDEVRREIRHRLASRQTP
jgi:putative addiction module CopG family antidote